VLIVVTYVVLDCCAVYGEVGMGFAFIWANGRVVRRQETGVGSWGRERVVVEYWDLRCGMWFLRGEASPPPFGSAFAEAAAGRREARSATGRCGRVREGE